MNNEEELIVPSDENLMVITIAPFSSVKHTIYDVSLGEQLDPQTVAKLSRVLQLRQNGKVSVDARVNLDHFKAAVDAVIPCEIFVKGFLVVIPTKLTSN